MTIVSHLQARGIINDHALDCPRYTRTNENWPTIRLAPNREVFGKRRANSSSDIDYLMLLSSVHISFMVDDEATLVLDYPGRMTGTIILSTGEGGITQRLEIAGTGGRILLDGNTLTLTRFGQNIRKYVGNAQVTSRQEFTMTTEEYVFGSDEHAYEIMLNNFGAAIRGEAPLIAPGRDGIATLELINAAYLSAWEGRRLQLPVDRQQYLLALQKHEKLEQTKEDGV